jgi:cytochrome c556
MRMPKVLTAILALLLVGVVFWSNGTAADEKTLREQIDKLADTAANNLKELQKQADVWVKENKDTDLDDVSNLLKKRTPDNPAAFGIGPKPTGRPDDGIEVRISNMAKKSPSVAQLKKEKNDLLQMINRIKAIGAVTRAHKPIKDADTWQSLADDTIQFADALGKAIETADTDAVKKAAAKLNNNCTDCHAWLRGFPPPKRKPK